MNFFRELVSGQKVRFLNGEYNLDLTYITNRVIAMSFPASGFESTFRNNIDDVAKFLYEHHGDQYKIFNLSNRKYNYEKFGENKINEFAWEDHHSPPIDMLFDVCKKVDDFLREQINNVAIIHCQAGKGRTGTLICCYLLYSGRCKHPQDARLYYSKKRFNKAKSGVTQPSQIRYIYYFHEIFRNPNFSPQIKIIDSITFIGPAAKLANNKSSKPYVDIYSVRDKIKIYSGIKEQFQEKEQVKSNEIMLKIGNQNLHVFGDILFKCYVTGTIRSKFLFRFAFNTCMVDEVNSLTFDLGNLDPDSTVKDKSYSTNFNVKVKFLSVCQYCSNRQVFSQKCQVCQDVMREEIPGWTLVYDIMKNYPKYNVNESRILLYGDPDYDDFDELVDVQSNYICFLFKPQESIHIEQAEDSDDQSVEASDNEDDEEKKQQN